MKNSDKKTPDSENGSGTSTKKAAAKESNKGKRGFTRRKFMVGAGAFILLLMIILNFVLWLDTRKNRFCEIGSLSVAPRMHCG